MIIRIRSIGDVFVDRQQAVYCIRYSMYNCTSDAAFVFWIIVTYSILLHEVDKL